LTGRVDVGQILERVDVNEVIGKVDLDAVIDRMDMNAVVQRVDLEALVEQTDLGSYAVWAFIYFAHFWGLNGKTAGGALFGVQVLTNEGGDVSGRRAIGRTLAFPLSFLILCLGFLGILLVDQRRALHDLIAGTVVIYC
jgi:RDD family